LAYSAAMIGRARFPSVCLILLALTGCSSTRPPGISVVSAQPRERTDAAATVGLTLRLQNPNNQPLELLEFDYSVEVDGKQVYRGTRSAQMTLARQSTREVELPAVIPFQRLGWNPPAVPAAAQVKVRGTLRYLLPGTFAQTLFDIGVRRPRVGFRGAQQASMTPPATVPTTQSAAFSDAR